MSWNPSLSLGSLYPWTKPLNAWAGRPSRASGFNSAFCDRTASLCWHMCTGVLNQMQRIGTFSLRARSTHTARVSGSRFVLSVLNVNKFVQSWCKVNKPIATELPEASASCATLTHLSRDLSVS